MQDRGDTNAARETLKDKMLSRQQDSPDDVKIKIIETSLVDTKDFVAEYFTDGSEAWFYKQYKVGHKKAGEIERVDKVPTEDFKGIYVPYKGKDSMASCCLWGSDLEEYGSEIELFNEICRFIHKWVEIPVRFEQMCAMYVMYTYQYENFREAPYLRVIGDLGSGKGQKMTAPILTPGGFIKMSEVRPGTILSTPDGETAQVKSLHPLGKVDIFKVTFSDNSSTEVTGDHLWDCWKTNPWKKYGRKIRTTLEIKDMIERTKQRIIIPLTAPVRFNFLPVPLDPYLIGALLGDGSLTKTNTIEVTKPDDHILQRIKDGLPEGIEMSFKGENTWCFVNNQNEDKTGGRKNILIEKLKTLGILPIACEDRFVPEEYKQNSFEVRRAVIQGLMDTDGTIGKVGGPVFTSKSERLAKDVQWLARSLGAKATITSGKKTCTNTGAVGTYFNVHIRSNHDEMFFSLPRKLARCKPFNRGLGQLGRRITSIELTGQEEAQCIYVDHPDHLYITDDFIVTHNTRLSVDVLGQLVYRPIRTIAASSMASIFRSLSDIKGSLVLDEADMNDKSDKTSEIVQLLNSGYKKGVAILRIGEGTGKGQKYKTEQFHVYGPKVICSREHMKDDALESRCIPIKMVELTRKDIPLFTDDSIETDGQHLRNMLYKWRYDKRGTDFYSQIDQHFLGLKMSSRVKQLFMILSSVIVDSELKSILYDYGEQVHAENTSRRGESAQGAVLEALRELVVTKIKDRQTLAPETEDFVFALTTLTRRVNEMRPEQDKEISSRYIGRIVRETCGFRQYRSNTIRGIAANLGELNNMFDRFGVKQIVLSEELPLTMDEALKDPELAKQLKDIIF